MNNDSDHKHTITSAQLVSCFRPYHSVGVVLATRGWLCSKHNSADNCYALCDSRGNNIVLPWLN